MPKLKIANADIIREQFPDDKYYYFIPADELLNSTNTIIQDTVYNLKDKSKLVLNNEGNKKKQTKEYLIKMFQHALERQVHLQGELCQGLKTEAVVAKMKDLFGEEDTNNIFEHYNQDQIYLLSAPFRVYYTDVWNNKTRFGIQEAQHEHYENIFSESGTTLRETSVNYLKINIPDMETHESQDWHYSIEYKIVSRLTANGFEVLGIGTDSPVVVNLLMNKPNACKQLELLMELVAGLKKQVLVIKTNLDGQVKAVEAKIKNLGLSANKEKDNEKLNDRKNYLGSKLVAASMIIGKIEEFKEGKRTMDKLVFGIANIIATLDQLIAVDNRGNPAKKSGLFAGRTTTAFAKVLKNFIVQFQALYSKINSNAAFAINPNGDLSAEAKTNDETPVVKRSSFGK